MLGGLGEAAGGAIGEYQARDKRKQSAQYTDKAYAELMGIPEPVLRQLVMEGKLDPALLGPSAMEGVNADPRAIDAQLSALERFKRMQDDGGLGAQERAKLAAARDEAAQYERGQRGALMNRFAAMGQGGSGAELAAQLQAQQSGADRLSRAGTDAAADAAQRVLHAAQQSGQLGSQVRGQSFSEGAAKAQAADAIARFNANMRNDAQRFNLQRGDQYAFRNDDNARQYEQDRIQRAKLRSGAHESMSGWFDRSADRQVNTAKGVGRVSGAGFDGAMNVGMAGVGMMGGSPPMPRQQPRMSQDFEDWEQNPYQLQYGR